METDSVPVFKVHDTNRQIGFDFSDGLRNLTKAHDKGKRHRHMWARFQASDGVFGGNGLSDGTSWIAVDWGTSNLRVWGIAHDGHLTFAKSSDKGMGRLRREDFPAALNDVIGSESAETGEVLIAGMAGARQGWIEAPYLEAPADLRGLAEGAVSPPMSPDGPRVSILPGVCQKTPGAENVMRGEETQLLGLSRLVEGYSGPVCMPGTHSKWAMLEGVRLTSFTTAMTGELYEVLRQHSVLRHSLDGTHDGAARDEGFAAGVNVGLESPQDLSSNLFTVRAASLLSGRGTDWCSGYLSGLLIGSEVGARRKWLSSGEIPLIGSPTLCRLYAQAIAQLGGAARTVDATEAILAGLKAAREFNLH